MVSFPLEPTAAITSPDFTNSPCFFNRFPLCLYTEVYSLACFKIRTYPVSMVHPEKITVPSAIALIGSPVLAVISTAK